MRKPRIFIGSSVEGLDIAYAIQENIDHESETTVWSQGIFELTNSALDDLLSTLTKTDIGVFIFTPDDITKIRNNTVKTTRDNVIFELGSFLGFLGKKRVAFVMPKGTKNFHLPTDLAGITPGYYNANRNDSNLQAALGPFCNQLRKKIQNTSILDLANFINDREEIKRIVTFKPTNWEFLLTKELLRGEIEKLHSAIREVKYELYISKAQNISNEDFINILSERGDTFVQLVKAFSNNYKFLVNISWGEPGKSGNENLIKEATLRMVSFGFKALEIEKEIKGYLISDKLSELKEFSRDWYIPITDAIIGFYEKLEFYFHENNLPNEPLDFNIKMETPPNVLTMTEKISEYNNRLPSIG